MLVKKYADTGGALTEEESRTWLVLDKKVTN